MGPQGLIPVFCSDATHAPVTSADQTATRIKVSWYSKETDSVELSYFVLYRAPEKFTLRIETATDGRPIRKVTFCPTGDSRQAPARRVRAPVQRQNRLGSRGAHRQEDLPVAQGSPSHDRLWRETVAPQSCGERSAQQKPDRAVGSFWSRGARRACALPSTDGLGMVQLPAVCG